MRRLITSLLALWAVTAVQKNPEDVAAKWARNLAGATEEIRRGIQNVQTAPGVAAANQATKYAQRVQAAVPKWQRNVAAVGLGEWQQAAIEKGIPRVASGAAAAQPKMASFMAQLLPHIDGLQRQVKAMPSTSLEDNIQRMTQFVRGMSQFRRTR